MKKRIYGTMALLTAVLLSACNRALPGTNMEGGDPLGFGKDSEENKVVVYNYGDYIDEDLKERFEEETGIQVVYDVFETNEEMYPKVESGAVMYDVICAGEYTIEKMIANGMLQEIDYDNIPNIKNIGTQYLEKCQEYDPGNRYSVPYTFGTVGILYNTTMVDEEVSSWDILWNEKYKDNILMSKSIRDAMAIGLISCGYSLNTDDPEEIAQARDLLIAQKPLVQAYVVDQAKDKMIGGEAALAVIYSGEYMEAKKENPDLAYVVPEEGSNYWTDAWVIPANATHKKNAEAWINFLCDAEVAVENFDYLWYPTPNVAAQKLLAQEIISDVAIFPDEEIISRCEILQFLSPNVENLYNDAFTEVLSH